jgi:two-component system response regulator FlrC
VAVAESSRRLIELARRVAASDCTVLISGESGTGKEVLARFIHRQSPRAAKPFVAVNCAAIPESMLEALLFGYERGAFTGAHSAHPGKFEQAQGGTLLLDEISEMPLGLQAKLLRVLQEREVRRVGENKTRPIDVRLVAATHRDLSAEVKAGRFREDLSFRLKVVTLHVPPLRERPEDVIPLAKVALLEATSRAKLPPKELSAAVSRALLEYRWPGNVRELFNAMERAAVLAERRTLQPEDLPPEVLAPTPAPVSESVGQTLEAVERGAILSTLAAERGNRAKTAKRLGIGPATLFRKLKQYQGEGYEVVPANG